ncbi:helix-turn-helix domain-containing protein [Sporolactobacillus shoreicorticis]|uniref:Helix-turn-helix domain-containing protein n=1 Tax=Sporolactobacillus shoreicorticis TaxID=1923877 RepID=A0ABW5S4M3_9BACL|nr:helix-turn-helix domain-containing protein [Sporolactobacillus shoreicorticis]MCO7124262.1 helix-turn-helix domain-containing protein [Sporolactobacillus shoreicorticis]
MATFSDRLKKLREEANLKQEDVAKKLRISTSAYGYYEQGRNEPSLETLLTLSVLFDASADYLMGQTNVRKHSSSYKINNLDLSADDIKLLTELKKYPNLIDQLITDPEKNLAALNRYWTFFQDELKTFHK